MRTVTSACRSTVAALLATAAMGAPGAFSHVKGLRPAAAPLTSPPPVLSISPSHTYSDANYATGGVGLRNRSHGVIDVSGLTGNVQDAWLYFAYLYNSTPPARTKLRLTRLFPAPKAAMSLTAKLFATSPDPCWDSQGGAIYPAQVPASLASGNGEYEVAPAIFGLDGGQDPWGPNGNVYPLDEGATLVLIGTTVGRTVDLFDSKLAGHEIHGTLSYTLLLSSPTTGRSLMESFGADGQIGEGRLASSYVQKTVTVNGIQISGPGSPHDTGSDWNGSSGFPMPQLWDDVGHDIYDAAAPGTSSLAVTVNSPNDCILPIGNVVYH